MSGISGILHRHRSADASGSVRRMVSAMAHRGPDGMSVWTGPGVALGHCALHTTPEAVHERLPLQLVEPGLVLTADARIDNRDDLIRELKPVPRTGPVVTDADLILEAYLKWGTSAPEHLLGDFAFAIWDEREQLIFCARDFIGTNPLYYYADSNFFAFATEIQALLSLPEVPVRVNHRRVAEYVSRMSIDPEATMLLGVQRLPAAHCMIVSRGQQPTLRRHTLIRTDQELQLESDEAYEKAFRDIFESAVHSRMRALTPVGVSLSGGLDSSSVAVIARDHSWQVESGPLDTFTARFGYEKADESTYLDALREQGGFAMHDVFLTAASPLQGIDEAIWHLGQPSFTCNVYMIRALGRALQESGIRTVLDGAEGDIAVGYGLGRIGELVLNGQWQQLSTEIAGLSRTTGGSARRLFIQHSSGFLSARIASNPLRFLLRDARSVAELHRLSSLHLLWTYWLKRQLPDGFLKRIPGVRQAASASERDTLLNPALAQEIQFDQYVRDQRKTIPATEYSERRRHGDVLNTDSAMASILEEANHLYAMHEVEARHPFYDVRLMQHCVSLPSDQKLREGYTRSILRRALQDRLPEVIARRMSKGDLSEKFDEHLLRSEADLVRSVLNEGRSHLVDFYDLTVLEGALDRGDSPTLWSAFSFCRWRTIIQNRRLFQGSQTRLPYEISDHTSEIAMS